MSGKTVINGILVMRVSRPDLAEKIGKAIPGNT
jgi:hypothetical protein